MPIRVSGYLAAVDRRAFLRRGGVGAAGAALAAGTGVGGVLYEKARTTREQEAADFGGLGRGAARLVWSVPTDQKVACLSFDDGPHPSFTPRVLDQLARHGIHATFFLVGTEVERHPDLVHRILDEGHEIGNHSYSHPHMAHLDAEAARREVRDGSAAIEEVAGFRPRWFRSPRGMLTGPIVQAAAQLHQDIAMWSAVTHLGAMDEPTKEITDHLLLRLTPGTIYDLHDGTSGREGDEHLVARRSQELPAYPSFISKGLDRGYRFVTLTELVAHAHGGPLA
jgi:peptidoglycan/xylan/chitin deacetylase (PgdA/CDA1 family)